MPYAEIADETRLYYELTGPADAPVIVQFGGGLFGRHNFALVNDGFRERFRLLSFDARGYGASTKPREAYTIEGWAEDGADVLLLGSTTMHQAGAYMAANLPAPVVNPGPVAIAMAEMFVRLGLSHSKVAYPSPSSNIDDRFFSLAGAAAG